MAFHVQVQRPQNLKAPHGAFFSPQGLGLHRAILELHEDFARNVGRYPARKRSSRKKKAKKEKKDDSTCHRAASVVGKGS
jgi:hypothetical protein